MAKSTCSLASTGSCSSSSSSSIISTSTSASSASSSGTSQRQQQRIRTTGGLLKAATNVDRRKRLAANARERKRMHLLNKAYDQLRKRLVDAENKSKYDVLVQAKEYIQALASICETFDQQNPNHHLAPVTEATTTTMIGHHHHQLQHDAKPVDMTNKQLHAYTPNELHHLQQQSPPLPHVSHINHHHHLNLSSPPSGSSTHTFSQLRGGPQPNYCPRLSST